MARPLMSYKKVEMRRMSVLPALVPALVGLSTPDFFSGYLDEAIDAALARMRAIRP